MDDPAPLPQLCAEHRADRIVIRRGELAILTQHAPRDQRVFIHPIAAPDSDGVITENEPPHHPWQHGLYVGLNDVNGVGYWTEGRVPNANDGSFHPSPLSAPRVSGNRADWEAESDWRAPDGSTQLRESQRWMLRDLGAAYELDLAWSLTAVADLTFGKHAYGGLFIRMPFRGNGMVVDSEGRKSIADCEARCARWVAIAMPIGDRKAADKIAGVAVMDHPTNPEHPTPWRVDGQLGVAPSRCIAGSWTLAVGAKTTSRYRIFIYCGATDVAAVESSWSRFIKQ